MKTPAELELAHAAKNMLDAMGSDFEVGTVYIRRAYADALIAARARLEAAIAAAAEESLS